MYKGFKKVLALLVAAALVFTSVPATKTAAKTKKSETITVTTQDELTAALKSGKYKKITLATDAKITITASGRYNASGVKLVIDAPNATIKNKAACSSVVIKSAAKFVEYASGNAITVKDDKLTLKVDEKAKVQKVTAAAGAETIKFVNNGSVGRLYVEAPADIAISGASEKKLDITVKTAAAGAEITSSLPVKVNAYGDIDLTLEDGAEKSSVTMKTEETEVKIDNNTDAAVTVKEADGSTEKVSAGKELVSEGFAEKYPEQVKSEDDAAKTDDTKTDDTKTDDTKTDDTKTDDKSSESSNTGSTGTSTGSGSESGSGVIIPVTPSNPTDTPTVTPEPEKPLTGSSAFTLSGTTATLTKSTTEDQSLEYTGTETLTVELGNYVLGGTLTVTAPNAAYVYIKDAGASVAGAIINNLVIDAAKAHVENSASVSGKVTVKAVSKNTFVQNDGAESIDMNGAGSLVLDKNIDHTPDVTVSTDEEVIITGDTDSVKITSNADVTLNGYVDNINVEGNATVNVGENATVESIMAIGELTVEGSGSVTTIDATGASKVDVTNNKVNSLVVGAETKTTATTKTVASIEFNTTRDIDGVRPGVGYSVFKDEEFDASQVQLIINYTDGTNDVIRATADMMSGLDLSKAGKQYPTYTFGGKSVTAVFPVTVYDFYRCQESDALALQQKLYSAKPGDVVEYSGTITLNKGEANGAWDYEMLFVPYLVTLKLTETAKINENNGGHIFVYGCLEANRNQFVLNTDLQNTRNILAIARGGSWVNGNEVYRATSGYSELFAYNFSESNPDYLCEYWYLSGDMEGTVPGTVIKDNTIEGYEGVKTFTYAGMPQGAQGISFNQRKEGKFYLNGSYIFGEGDGSNHEKLIYAKDDPNKADCDLLYDRLFNLNMVGAGKYQLKKNVDIIKSSVEWDDSGLLIWGSTLEIADGGSLTMKNKGLKVWEGGKLIADSAEKVKWTDATVDENGNIDYSAAVILSIGHNSIFEYQGVDFKFVCPGYDTNGSRQYAYNNCIYQVDGKLILKADCVLEISDSNSDVKFADLGISFAKESVGKVINYNGIEYVITGTEATDIVKMDDCKNDAETAYLWLNGEIAKVSQLACANRNAGQSENSILELDTAINVPDGHSIVVRIGVTLKLVEGGAISFTGDEDYNLILEEDEGFSGTVINQDGKAMVVSPITYELVPMDMDNSSANVSNLEQLHTALNYFATQGSGTVTIVSGAAIELKGTGEEEDKAVELFVPAGVTLKFAEGAKLAIAEYASLIVAGTLESKEANIVCAIDPEDEICTWWQMVAIRFGATWKYEDMELTATPKPKEDWIPLFGYLYSGGFNDSDQYCCFYSGMWINDDVNVKAVLMNGTTEMTVNEETGKFAVKSEKL